MRKSDFLILAAVGWLAACGTKPGAKTDGLGAGSAAVTLPAVDPRAAIGRLSSVGNGLTRTYLQYDLAGRPVISTYRQEARPAMVFVTTYGYARRAAASGELGGVVRSVAFPDGEVVSYSYDLGGAAQAVRSTPPGGAARDIVTKIIRNDRGQTLQLHTGDGTVTQYRYNDEAGLARTDRRLRLSVTKHGARVLQGFQYRFDAVGNVTEVASVCPDTTGDCTCDPLAGSCAFEKESACYRYDELDRLTSAQTGTRPAGGAWCAGDVQSYAYDAIDNLTVKAGKAQGYGFAGARPHAISSWTGVTLAASDYDANGNLLRLPGKVDHFTWNVENMPVYETGPGGTTQRWYVGESLWKRSTTGSPITYYLPHLRVEGSSYRKHYASFAERESTDANPIGTLRFYHGDHLGSSTLVVSADGGQIVHRSSYLPYGEDRASAGTFTPKYRFNFKEKQTLTALYDYGARLYNPETGRWISPDTSSQDGLNRYAYTRNNPLRYVDPTGHNIFRRILSPIGRVLTKVGHTVGGNSSSDEAAQLKADLERGLAIITRLDKNDTLLILAQGILNFDAAEPDNADTFRKYTGVNNVISVTNSHGLAQAYVAKANPKSAQVLLTLIKAALDKGIPMENIVLAAHSNGNPTLLMALQHLQEGGRSIHPAATFLVEPNMSKGKVLDLAALVKTDVVALHSMNDPALSMANPFTGHIWAYWGKWPANVHYYFGKYWSHDSGVAFGALEKRADLPKGDVTIDPE